MHRMKMIVKYRRLLGLGNYTGTFRSEMRGILQSGSGKPSGSITTAGHLPTRGLPHLTTAVVVFTIGPCRRTRLDY